MALQSGRHRGLTTTKYIFLDEKGVTRVFKAGDAFEQVAENKLEGTKFWSSVAVAGNGYLFKGGERLFYVKE